MSLNGKSREINRQSLNVISKLSVNRQLEVFSPRQGRFEEVLVGGSVSWKKIKFLSPKKLAKNRQIF